MEYCPDNLYKMKSSFDQEEKIVDLLLQLSTGLRELHINNISHLDIKPGKKSDYLIMIFFHRKYFIFERHV